MKRPFPAPDGAHTPATDELHLRSSLLIAALALLGVLWLHLLSSLLAGLGGFVLYRWIRGRAMAYTVAPWKSRPLTLFLLTLALGLLALALFEAFELLLSASSDGLARLLQLLADTLDQIRATAPQWLASRLPDSAAAMQEQLSGWLRSHAGDLQHWSRQALHVLVDLIVGLAIGLMIGASATPQPAAALPRLARARLRQLVLAFSDVVAAQLRISLINTALTALYLLVILPALNYHVPLATTLVVFTFFAVLLPIAGNLLSNTAITLAALTVSPLLGAVSLGFLVVVHKLEYFLNARIVGDRIRVPAYGLLASMLVLEAAFGVAGVVAAPIYCAWLTRELRGGNWL